MSTEKKDDCSGAYMPLQCAWWAMMRATTMKNTPTATKVGNRVWGEKTQIISWDEEEERVGQLRHHHRHALVHCGFFS